jgi:hypothetical protein
MANPIKHLKDRGKGRRVFLVGNGPSIADMDLSLLRGEDTIAMNRIDMIYSKTIWRPTYYIFCSDNCRNTKWGKEWSKSVVTAASEPDTTPIIWKRYKGDIERRGGNLPSKTIYLNSVSENRIGTPQAFSADAEKRVDKSGTTMNVALQLAYYMGYDETYLIGCDSNWKTAKNTKAKGGSDPNHFDPKYHAMINNGAHEFQRMNNTHKRARKAFDAAGRKIFNAGINSAINAYEKVPFHTLIAKNKPVLCCGELMFYWFEGEGRCTEFSNPDMTGVVCKKCAKHYPFFRKN